MNAKEMQSITAASRARTGNPIITEIRALRPGDTATLPDNYGDGEHTFTLIALRAGDAPGIETLFFVHNPGSTSDTAGFVFEMDRATDGDFQDQVTFAETDLYDALDPYGTEYVYTDAEALTDALHTLRYLRETRPFIMNNAAARKAVTTAAFILGITTRALARIDDAHTNA